MTASTRRLPGTNWLGELIEAARRVFAFGHGHSSIQSAAAARSRRTRKPKSDTLGKRSAEVRKLAAAGLAPAEIARRTRLSQDTVALLITVAAIKPDVSAARGTFFRIFRRRAAA